MTPRSDAARPSRQPREWTPFKRFRARLAHRIYPFWREQEIEAAWFRAHTQRNDLGLSVCHDVDEPCPVSQKGSRDA